MFWYRWNKWDLHVKSEKNKIFEELRKSQKFRVDRDDVFKDMRRHTMKRKELREKLMETNKNRQKRITFT